jgi:hypothetical protein
MFGNTISKSHEDKRNQIEYEIEELQRQVEGIEYAIASLDDCCDCGQGDAVDALAALQASIESEIRWIRAEQEDL